MLRQNMFLRYALLADAVASGATGLMMIAGAGLLEGLLGLPAALMREAGLVLVPYVAFVAWVGTREAISRPAVQAIIAMNVLWVVGSAVAAVRFRGADHARLRLRDRAGDRGRRVRRAAIHRPAPPGRRCGVRRRHSASIASGMRRRVPASTAHFAVWASRLITCRFGKPQNRSSDGQSMSRCSRQTRNSGTRWSTSEVFHSRAPLSAQRRPCSRRNSLAWSLGAFHNRHAVTQAVCQVAFAVRAALPQVHVPAEPIDRLAADAAEARPARERLLADRARAGCGSLPARSLLRPSFSRQVQPAGVPLRARVRARAGRRAADARASSRRPRAAASAASSAG